MPVRVHSHTNTHIHGRNNLQTFLLTYILGETVELITLSRNEGCSGRSHLLLHWPPDSVCFSLMLSGITDGSLSIHFSVSQPTKLIRSRERLY